MMPGHIFWKNKEGIYCGCNLQQAKDAGFNTPDEMIGKPDKEMPWGMQADYLRANDLKIMNERKGAIIEELFELPDGTKKIYLSNKQPLFDEHNQVVGIVGISFDITDRKNAEEELKKAKESAEAANNAKSQFIENMEHDIRTPFCGIHGLANILLEMETDQTKKEYLEAITESSTQLLEYCNKIIDYARIENSLRPVVAKKFELKSILNKVIQMIKPAADVNHLEMKIYFDEHIPEVLIGDSERLERILINVIGNAIKFTQTGYIKIQTSLGKIENKTVVVCFLIKDTGIGIPEEKINYIYERFARGEAANTNKYKGPGLGLTVIKQLMKDLDGEIDIKSEVNKGTLVTLTLPFQLPLLNNI